MSTTSTEMTLVRTETFDNTVVFVDGLTRTGKSMLGPILASFERIEIERVEEIFEFIGGFVRLRQLKRSAAISLLRLYADLFLYNGMIGRNSNFRYEDHSGVMNFPNPRQYYERLAAPEGNVVAERIETERPIFQNQTHDQLMNFELFSEAYSNRFRMLQMLRHPVDLADSWHRRGWGTRFGNDPLAFTHCIECNGQDVPYYAAGWEREFLESSDMGRIIRMISRLYEACQQTYAGLSDHQKSQIYFIRYDDFVVDPWLYMDDLASFVGTKPSQYTTETLRRERCPRPSPVAKRSELSTRVFELLDEHESSLLQCLIEHYEHTRTGVNNSFAETAAEHINAA